MKNQLKIYVVFIGLWVFSSIALATPNQLQFKEKGILSVCSYSEFTPISYGKGQGYEADLLRAIARLWHVKIKFYPENIYEGIWHLPSRTYSRCDIAIGGITPLPSRVKENASFSNTTTTFNQSLLVRKEDYAAGRIVSYASFKANNMKIGVVPGTTGEQYAHVLAKKNGVPMSVFVQYTSESELLPALMKKEIDAIARGEIGNEYQSSLHKNLVTVAKNNFHEAFAVAVDSTNKPLLHQLNQSIDRVSNHGKINYWQWLNDRTVFKKQITMLNHTKNLCH